LVRNSSLNDYSGYSSSHVQQWAAIHLPVRRCLPHMAVTDCQQHLLANDLLDPVLEMQSIKGDGGVIKIEED
jgi:hypothetical protein